MSKIKEIKGNIFDTECEYIVNAVNCLGYMGKGIALEFKLRFKDMNIEYQNDCKQNILIPGVLSFWEKSNPKIINFPTKYDFKHPSKMEYITKGLITFQKEVEKRKINSVAFPQLGSKLGGLKWEEVKEEMYRYLSEISDLYIEIYDYDSNVNDKKMNMLKELIENTSCVDFAKKVGIKEKEMVLIYDSIINKNINSFTELNLEKGIGSAIIMKITEFLYSDNNG